MAAHRPEPKSATEPSSTRRLRRHEIGVLRRVSPLRRRCIARPSSWRKPPVRGPRSAPVIPGCSEHPPGGGLARLARLARLGRAGLPGGLRLQLEDLGVGVEGVGDHGGAPVGAPWLRRRRMPRQRRTVRWRAWSKKRRQAFIAPIRQSGVNENKGSRRVPQPLEIMVGDAGFEPKAPSRRAASGDFYRVKVKTAPAGTANPPGSLNSNVTERHLASAHVTPAMA